MERVLLIALGGGIGSVLRYLTAMAATRWLGAEFPFGTLIVNGVGAFLIGLVQQVAIQALLVPEHLRLFVVTGLLGGLTTYSAFSYETVRLFELQAWPQAVLNVVVTTVMCLVLCSLGIAAGRFLVRG